MIERDSGDFVFDVDQADIVSSGDMVKPERIDDVTDPVNLPLRPAADEMSAVFKELAAPKLPELAKENRARLQMQSPNRLFFYWSIKNNPFQTLKKAFGHDTGSYTLVAKLLDLSLFVRIGRGRDRRILEFDRYPVVPTRILGHMVRRRLDLHR